MKTNETKVLDQPSRLSGQCPAKGRVAAITGVGAGGIGEAVAEELAIRQGYELFASDINAARGTQTCELIRRKGGKMHFIHADTATSDGIELFFDSIQIHTGRLDLLVNNAGSAGDPAKDNLLDLDIAAFQKLLEINVTGPVMMTKEALRRFMLPQGRGVVIFVGSLNGGYGRGQLGQLGYGTAKTALTSVLAQLTAQFGSQIRFNLVRPGITVTNSENWQKRSLHDPMYEAREAEQYPSKRLMYPADIARAIAWLASDEARLINGVELAVDGGQSAAGILHPAWEPSNFRASYVQSVAALENSPERQAS